MTEEPISEVGIDGGGRLFVRPSETRFDQIHRAAMAVGWDEQNRYLVGPRPEEWSYLSWFDQIVVAVADEYRVRLKLTSDTLWTNVPDAVKAEIAASG